MRRQRPLSIPLLIGTPWLGRACENLAHRLVREVAGWRGVETELLDIRALVSPDVPSTQLRNPCLARSLQHTDGIILLFPEYGYGYPARLHRAIEANLTTHVPRAVGLCGLTAEAFTGVQVLPELLPTLRALSLIPISQDRHFDRLTARHEEVNTLLPTGVGELFREELLWMATALRCGREACSGRTSFALQESDHDENQRRNKIGRISSTGIPLEALGTVS